MNNLKSKFKFIKILPIVLWVLMWPMSGLHADSTNGLTYHTFQSSGQSPQLPSDNSSYVSSGVVSEINFNWGGSSVLDSGIYNGVLVKFTGWIKPPVTETYYICGNSDDGFRLYLDGVLVVDDWYDRGGGCGQTADVDFSDGQPKELTAYYYENGGGAAVQLMYYTDQLGWAVVPTTWFTTETPATTTTSTTTTTTSTTTTVPETTTTTTVPQSIGVPLNLTVTEIETGFFLDWDEPTDGNVSPERYAVSWSVEGIGGWGWATGNVGDERALITEITVPYNILESTGGLDQTYVFKIRSDNDSLGMYSSWSNTVEMLVSTPTTTTTSTTSTTTTTTTTVPPTTTTTPPAPVVAPPPVTSAAPTTATPATTTAPTTTAAPTTVATTAPTTVVTTPPTTVATTTPTTVATSAPTTVATTAPKTTVATTQPPEPVLNEDPPSDPDPEIEEPVVNIQEAPVEQIVQNISRIEVLTLSVSDIEVVFSNEILSELDEQEIEQLIDQIHPDEITDEQGEAIATAMSDAPENVKEEFESEINIFGGQFDSYVAIGSKITVGERRVIVAVAAVTMIAPAPVVASRRK